MTLPPRSKALIESHIAVFFFGMAGLFGKWLSLPPALLVFWRTLLASLGLGIFILITGQWKRPRQIWPYLLLGPLLAGHWMAFFHAIQLSSVAVGLLTFSTFPVFTVLMEPIFFKESLTIRNITAALTVLAGVALIIPQWQWGARSFSGALWGVASGASFALLALFNRRLLQRDRAVVVAFFQNSGAALMLLPLTAGAGLWPGWSGLGKLTLLGLFCTALAHWLFIQSMSVLKARLASLIATLEPVYGVVFAWLLLHELPSARTLAGGFIILITVVFMMRPENNSKAERSS